MRSCFLITLLLLYFSASSQVVVKGRVLDALNREPVAAATVITADSNAATITDQQGFFSLRSEAADATIIISSNGYASAKFHSTSVGAEILLQPAPVQLKDVLVIHRNLPASFQSLARNDLELRPVKNTQELMRIVPGLFVAQHAGGGKAEQIFLRGFDCDHGTDIAVSVDGMPVNMVSHAHGQGYADAHFIIPETVNKIDFGAGPYYAQQGNLNTAGFVGFNTSNTINGNRVQLEAGSFNSFRALAMFDLLPAQKEKQSAYIASEYNYTDGPTVSKQHFKRSNIFFKYRLALNNNTQLSASLSAFNSRWNASGQVPERAVESGLINRFGSIDPTEGGATSRYNANVKMVNRLSSQHVLTAQFYYSRYSFNLRSNFTFFLLDSANGDAIRQAENRNLFGGSLELKTNNRAATIQSSTGIGFRKDDIDGSTLSQVPSNLKPNALSAGDIAETGLFAFTRHQFSTGNWLIDAGLRIDHLRSGFNNLLDHSQQTASQTIISPKLNIQYTFNSRLQFYFKTGKGFHSNDARVAASGEHQLLAAAHGSDLGFIWKPDNKWLFNIAAWWLQLDQELVYAGDDGTIEPRGKTDRHGIDITARYQASAHLFASLNVNLTRAVMAGLPKGQNFIPLAPLASSTGGIFYKADRGFNGGLSYRYLQSRPANEDNSITAKGYFVADLAVNYTRKRYEIGISVENLLNTRWNEAQFATTSRLRDEPAAVTDLNFTPGNPIGARVKLAVFF
jgi:outer membrane cobalamin receptor